MKEEKTEVDTPACGGGLLILMKWPQGKCDPKGTKEVEPWNPSGISGMEAKRLQERGEEEADKALC